MFSKLSRSQWSALTALISYVGFCLPILVKTNTMYNAVPLIALKVASADIGFGMIYLWSLWYVLTIHRFVTALCLPVLFVTSTIAMLFVVLYHVELSPDVVRTGLETNLQEILSFSTLPFLFGVIFSLLISIGLLWPVLQGLIVTKPDPKRLFILSIFVLGLLFTNDGGLSNSYPPYPILKAVVQTVTDHQLLPKKRNLGHIHADVNNASKDLVVVLVIGESARADHFRLNGYIRNTNPFLSQEQHVISFQQTRSCTTLTRTAVPCMLTRGSEKHPEISKKETSLISIFNRAGFMTSWIGVQGARSFIDSPFLDIANEASDQIFLNTHAFFGTLRDMDSLPFLTEKLNHPPPLLIVLHSYGSHWPYTTRYPPDYATYKPECAATSFIDDIANQVDKMSECYKRNPQALINSYDNSIRYTDAFLHQIIERLRHRNALLIYASDHGESLGEDGRFLHGSIHASEQRNAATFFWFSDRFIASNPKAYQQAIRFSKRPLISHDILFHSILGCAGVMSKLIDPRLDICH